MSNTVGFDIRSLVKFGNALNDYENFETAIMTATQKIARVLHQEVVRRSPIDTGNLRKMWSAGDNLLFYVERKPGGYEVTLVNEARNAQGFKYPWVVNYSPRSKHRFFVERSVLVTERVTRSIIKKELIKWFKGCLSGK